jgi:hypothetical protein
MRKEWARAVEHQQGVLFWLHKPPRLKIRTWSSFAARQIPGPQEQEMLVELCLPLGLGKPGASSPPVPVL